MKKLKNKKKVSANSVPEVVEKTSAVEESNSRDKVSVEKMDIAITLVCEKFNLHGYTLTGFKDKGNSAILALSNGDFSIGVTINSCEKFGIVSPEESVEKKKGEEDNDQK